MSKKCPSARCELGASLLGIVGPDGRVIHLAEPLSIDANFVAVAEQGRAPERRFRFVAECVEGRCRQWTGSSCGVIDAVVADAPIQPVTMLPRCAMRRDCRWFSQHGGAACRVCDLVVTDARRSTATST